MSTVDWGIEKNHMLMSEAGNYISSARRSVCRLTLNEGNILYPVVDTVTRLAMREYQLNSEIYLIRRGARAPSEYVLSVDLPRQSRDSRHINESKAHVPVLDNALT